MARFPTRARARATRRSTTCSRRGPGSATTRARATCTRARARSRRWPARCRSAPPSCARCRASAPYTAGAIASIAFGERAPLVDGNVARVLARVFAIDDDIKSAAGQRALWARAGELMAALPDGAAPGDLNQGLMELGATLCAPAAPRCLACPLAAQLRDAARDGRQDELPVARAQARRRAAGARARRAVDRATTASSCSRAAAPTACSAGCGSCRRATTPVDVARALGVTRVDAEPVAHHDQTLTHRRLRIAVFRARDARAACRRRAIRATTPSRACRSRARRELGIAAATTAILTKYEDTPWSSIPKRSPSSPKATTRSSKASRSSATTSTTRTSRDTARARRERRSTSSSTTRSR